MEIKQNISEYRKMLYQHLPFAFVYLKISYSETNKPVSSLIVEVNDEFLKNHKIENYRDVINKPLYHFYPELARFEDNWLTKLATMGSSDKVLHDDFYSAAHDQYFTLTVYSPERGYVMVVFNDMSSINRLNQQLLDNKQLLEQVFDLSIEGIRLINKSHEIFSINKAYLAFLEKTLPDCLGSNCYDIFCAKTCSLSGNCFLDRILNGEDHIEETISIVLPNTNQLQHYILNALPLRNSKNEIYGILESVRNITDLKNAEEAMKKQSVFLATLLDTIPNPVFFKNTFGKYIGCNKAFVEMMGIPKENIIGNTVFELSPYDLAVTYNNADHELFQTKKKQVYDAKVKYANNETHDVIFYKDIFYDNDQNIAGLVGIVHDITPRKKAEEILEGYKSRLEIKVAERNARLEQTLEKFQQIFNTTSDGIAIYDIEQEKYIEVNKTLLDLKGITQEQFLEYERHKFFCTGENPFTCEEFTYYINKAIDGQQQLFEWKFNTNTLGIIWIEVVLKCAHINDKPSVIASIRNITERKETESLSQYRIQRIETQETAIVELATNEFVINGDLLRAANTICSLTHKAINASNVSLWLFDNDYKKLYCYTWFNGNEPNLTIDFVLNVTDYSNFFLSIDSSRILSVEDAAQDSRFYELEHFLTSYSIRSLTIAHIKVGGDIKGIILIGNTEIRKWEHDEVIFGGEIAGQAAQAILNSERKKAELALIENENKLRTIFNTTSDAITITDLEGNVIEANDIAIERTGISREEMMHLSVFDMLNLEKHERLEQYRKEIIQKGMVVFEASYINRDGRHIFLEISSKLVILQGQKAIIHLTRDITERKNMDIKISRTIFETEEKERNRFAQDLHDGLGALLSGIKMYLNMLQKDRAKPDKQEELVSKAKELLGQAAQTAREIAHNIKPTELNQFGLSAALIAFIERIKVASNIQINFDASKLNVTLDEDIQFVLYRVVSELINNTLKHAGASSIDITIFAEKNLLRLMYADNGKGFDLDSELKKTLRGMGINNVISRIKSINGKINLQSAPNKGFEANIELHI